MIQRKMLAGGWGRGYSGVGLRVRTPVFHRRSKVVSTTLKPKPPIEVIHPISPWAREENAQVFVRRRELEDSLTKCTLPTVGYEI